jgi:hypothetical protein
LKKKKSKLFIILASHMESFILGSECWKFGSLDMEWPIYYISERVHISYISWKGQHTLHFLKVSTYATFPELVTYAKFPERVNICYTSWKDQHTLHFLKGSTYATFPERVNIRYISWKGQHTLHFQCISYKTVQRCWQTDLQQPQ